MRYKFLIAYPVPENQKQRCVTCTIGYYTVIKLGHLVIYVGFHIHHILIRGQKVFNYLKRSQNDIFLEFNSFTETILALINDEDLLEVWRSEKEIIGKRGARNS